MKYILCILLLLPLHASAGDGNSANGENRCDDLGSACVCSEALDTSETITTSVHNPGPSTTNECNGGPFIEFPSASLIRFASESGMPGGNTVTNVLEMDDAASDPTFKTLGSDVTTFSSGTVCTRGYQRYNQALINSFTNVTNDRIKIIEFGMASCPIQMTWAVNGPTSDAYVGVGPGTCSGPGEQMIESGDAITIQDCVDGWCRMEFCATVSGGTTTLRGRQVALATSKTHNFDFTFSASTIDLGGEGFWIGNHYIEQDIDVAGERYASFEMEAFWSSPQASNVWIGAASEVEGGAAAPSGSQGSGSFSISDLMPTWRRYVHGRLGLQ